MRTWAVLPVKALGRTKSRLAGVLSPVQRADLTHALLERTLVLLRAVAGIDQTLVITADPRVTALAQRYGAEVLPETQPGSLNRAAAQGLAHAARMDAARVLVLPSDLPCLSAQDVERVLETAQDCELVLCGDRVERGTNALLLPATAVFRFQYGPQSFARHRREAARLGLSWRTVATPGLQFDLDTAADWERFCRLSPELPVYSSGGSPL